MTNHVPAASTHGPRIAILLGIYNGERYLPEQLDSLSSQSYPHWCLWASDDGSDDASVAVLERYRAVWGQDRLRIVSGSRAGFARNFLSLVCRVDVDADYFAYADQDDIWEPWKLSRALGWLMTIDAATPALYCGRTRLMAENGELLGCSPLFSRAPGFPNALVQNIGGGNTMVFNAAARALLLRAGAQQPIVSHDWWTYLVVSGCGGRVFYDPEPMVRYRQHDGNLVGSNSSWLARWVRIKHLARGRFRLWNEINIAALRSLESDLTPQSRLSLEHFAKARQQRIVARLTGFLRSGVYRQTLLGQLGLIAAALGNRL